MIKNMEAITKKYGKEKSLRTSYFELGRSLFKQKRYDQAEKAFQHALQVEEEDLENVPTKGELQLLLGRSYEKQNKFSKAVQSYLLGSLNSTENFSTYLTYANETLSRENAAQIYSWIEEIWLTTARKLTLNTKQETELDFFSGRLDLYLGKYEEAEKTFKRILSKASRVLKVNILEGLGEIYHKQGYREEAKEKLGDAISKIKKNHLRANEIKLKYIQLLLEEQDYQYANEQLEEIKATKQGVKLLEKTTSKFIEAQILYGLGKWENVIEILEEIPEELQNHLFFVIKINALLALHLYFRAYDEINRALQFDPLNETLLFFKIQCLIEGQIDIEKGVELFIEEDGYFDSISFDKKIVGNKLSEIIKRRPNDGNTYFFQAFILHLAKSAEHKIDHAFKEAKRLGLKVDPQKADEFRYPVIGLQILEGELAVSADKLIEASIAFHKAGERLGWQNDHKKACLYLEKTYQLLKRFDIRFEDIVEKDGNFKLFYWNYTNSLLHLSYIKSPPYADKTKLDKSLRLWQASPIKVIENPRDYWGFHLIGIIHENLYRVGSEEGITELWKSLYYVERALIHKPEYNGVWTFAANCYHNVSLFYNSYHLIEEAISKNSSDLYALEEQTRIALNSGDFQEAKRGLDILNAKETNEHIQKKYLGWSGFIDYHNQNYNSAIEKIEQYLASNPNDLWGDSLIMESLWKSGRFFEAKEKAESLWNLKDKVVYKGQGQELIFAKSAYILGMLKESKQYVTVYLDTHNNIIDAYNDLCLIQIRLNYWEEANKSFEYYLLNNRNIRRFKELVKELKILAQLPNDTPFLNKDLLNDKINQPDTGWKFRIDHRIQEVQNEKVSPQKEIQEEIDRLLQQNCSESDFSMIGLKAGLARLELEDENLFAALKHYKELALINDIFPEASFGIEKVLDSIIQKHHYSFTPTATEKIITELRQSNYVQVEFEAKEQIVSLILCLVQNLENLAIQQLHQIISLIKKYPKLAEIFHQFIPKAIPKITHYWKLEELIDSVKKEHKHLLSWDILNALQDSLKNYWTNYINYSQSAEMIPIVTPIAIELASNLIPEGSDSEWPVFKKYIPELRTYFKQKYGVEIPGIRLRKNLEIQANQYIIIFDDIPLLIETLKDGKIFIPSLSLFTEDLKSSLNYFHAQHPFTGEEAAWIDESHKETLEAEKLIYWDDPFQYIIEHLKYILLGKLAHYHNIQSSYDYLHLFETKNSDLKKGIDQIKSDDGIIILFTKVLKELLSEKVPIISKEQILSSFDWKNAHNIELKKIAQKIRLKLKEHLRGNNPVFERVSLPKEVEKIILNALKHNETHKTFLAMEPEVIQEVLTKLQNLVGGFPSLKSLVLEVENTEIRPYVKELIKLEFPDLIVVSKEEILIKKNSTKE